MRAGASWNSYRAGDRLDDSVTVFVRDGVTPGMRVTSHFEKLAQSACRRASGDKLWCGSCHDPHTVPAAGERAAWFRRKCESCHAENACKETRANRARRQDDCVACHMPKSAVTDAQHVVYTDHSIPRRPRPAAAPPSNEAALVAFGGATASARDLALAYGIAGDRRRALPLLEEAAKNSPGDSEVLLYLAEIYRDSGQPDRAIPLYRRAMQLDPGAGDCLGGAGRDSVRARAGCGGDRLVAGCAFQKCGPGADGNQPGDGAMARGRPPGSGSDPAKSHRPESRISSPPGIF